MRNSGRATLLLIGASWSAASAAQAAPVPATGTAATNAADQRSDTLGDIIVTAQKRETRLERTPVTINVVSGQAIADAGTRELKDLKASVPGLTINEAPGGLTGVSLRGVGTTSGSQLFEQSVGLFVDGVYNPRARQFRNAIFDVERIEVIKGGQGVLFGKNTSIGAISVISRTPGDALAGYVEGRYDAALGSWSGEGAVDLPVDDTLAVRLAGFYDDTHGYVRNVTLDREEQREKRWLIRGTVDWKPTDTFTAVLKLQAGQSRAVGNTFQFLDTTSPATLTALGVLSTDPFVKYEQSQPLGDQFDRQRSFDPTLTLNYETPGGSHFTSITGYQNYHSTYGFDSDSTPLPLVYNFFEENFSQITQELRFASPTNRPLEFVGGFFYQHQIAKVTYQLRFLQFPLGPGLELSGIANQFFRQDEDAFAGFGQATWNISPLLAFDAGARLSQDDKHGNYVKTLPTTYSDPASLLPFVSPPSATRGVINDLTLDLSGTLSYKFTDSSVLYGSVGRGAKGAAFNNTSLLTSPLPDPFIVPKEVATTYEAGVKSRFLGNRAYVGLALFHLDIANYQDSYYSAAAQGQLIRSIGAKTSGAEGEAQFQASPWLNLFGNFSYTPKAQLANGERMQRAPRFTGVVGAKVDTPLTETLKFDGNVQLQHSSTYYNQPPGAPGNNLSGEYNLVSARIAVTYVPGKIELSVTGDNLTNDRYKPFDFGSPLGLGTIGTYNRPRTVVFGAKISF